MKWAFPIPPDTAVITSVYVTRDRLPILVVSREQDEDEGDQWQFHSGNGDYDPSKLQVVRLDELLSLDPSLAAVADLTFGHTARRATRDDPWTSSVEH